MNYNIIKNNNLARLIECVNYAIKQGWEPLGGVMINDDTSFCGETVYYQTMVKRG